MRLPWVINVFILLSTSFIHAQLDMHSRMIRQAQTNREAVNRFNSNTQAHMKTFGLEWKARSFKYKFFIVDLNNDTIDTKEKIKISSQFPIRKLIYKSNKEAYTPDNTKGIYVIKKSRMIKGIKHGEYWIFKTYTAGDYSFYALYPELNSNFITLYQFKNSPIRTLDVEMVKKIVSDNEKATEALNRKGANEALNILFWVAMRSSSKVRNLAILFCSSVLGITSGIFSTSDLLISAKVEPLALFVNLFLFCLIQFAINILFMPSFTTSD